MKQLSRHQLKTLLLNDTPPCISVYVPLQQVPTESPGRYEGCYRNLVDTAEQLMNLSYSESVVDRMLAPLRAFDISSAAEAVEARGTLVLFKSPTVEGFVHVPTELPGLAVVANSFHLKPIVELLVPDDDFYLLGLEHGRAILFQGNRHQFEPVREFLLSDADFERIERIGPPFLPVGYLNRLLLRVGFRPEATVGDATDYFISHVEAQVRAVMLRASKAPLFVAARRDLARLYRRHNQYQNLRRSHIRVDGRLNLEQVEQRRELHHQGLALAQRILRRRRAETIASLPTLMREGRLVVNPHEVVRALARGEVTTLFACRDDLLWGTIDWNTGTLRVNPCQMNAIDDDVIDDCLERALEQGGVEIVTMGSQDSLTAIGPLAAVVAPRAQTLSPNSPRAIGTPALAT